MNNLNYSFALINMCDECSMTLQRNRKIMENYVVKELNDTDRNNCKICNKSNRFTKSVLTNYLVDAEISEKEALEALPRTIDIGFKLLLIEDKLKRTNP